MSLMWGSPIWRPSSFLVWIAALVVLETRPKLRKLPVLMLELGTLSRPVSCRLETPSLQKYAFWTRDLRHGWSGNLDDR